MNAVKIVRRMASSNAPFVPMPTVVHNGKKYTRMVFPYTFTAQVANYNWVFEFKNNYFFRYCVYAYGFVVFPLCLYIDSIVNSPQAKAAWKAKKKADAEKELMEKIPYYEFLKDHVKH